MFGVLRHLGIGVNLALRRSRASRYKYRSTVCHNQIDKMEHLLLCETKAAVEKIVDRTFRRRNFEEPEQVQPLLEFYIGTLQKGINTEQAADLHAALLRLIKKALYLSAQLSTEEDYVTHLEECLPSDRKLAKMMIKVI